MILVADSGSSKTDWLLDIPGQEKLSFRSSGLNPYFLNDKQIVKILQEQVPDMIAYNQQIKEIYFFGAGCSSPDRHEIVSNALSVLFTKAFISVDSDLLGSAYATCGHEKGICCVLGTGSNISFFDGEEIHAGKHGLGYVLGDEGSGTWIGRILVTDYLYGRMPADVAAAFKKEYKLTKDQVMLKVYERPNANTYLASFARFLVKVKETVYAQQLIEKSLTGFIETNIKSYPEYHKYKCHFVGSIAEVYSEELKALCKAQDVQVGKILKHPIDDLMQFILKKV
ncbi:N-acetylglucosamine kinase [Mucilaginibacter sp. RS28]|uniref:N-acetylglucosamine kinase n=1 Tax=Mucilaginibacter straminoryzae TaxID=2932774 RepID=A0A9X1WZC6_9SPHI|nr:N-acetylglucosamine kinase [Mucilaginibacter straminoryzae]MCJ8208208.1 N-acetylglucosamine kinase [Mucilaginibacter straminoryzae]